MNDNKKFPLDELLNNHSKGELTAYFRTPHLDFPTLSVFAEGKGFLAVTFENAVANAYVLYNSEGKLCHNANLNVINIDSEKISSYEETTMTDFVKTYGKPHADLGSGRAVPAYLSDHASIYRLIEIGGRIKKILELKFQDQGLLAG